MKLGVNLWTVYGWEPAEFISTEVLQALRGMGADGVELTVDQDQYTSARLIAERDHLLPQLRESRLTVPSVASRLFWTYNLGSQDESIRRAGIQAIREQCEVARAFGADVALVVAGFQEPRTDYDQLYDRAVQSLQTAAGFAEETGVTIGVENVPASFLLSPREFRQFLRDVGSAWVKAYVDVGNVPASGLEYPENFIAAVSGSIAMVHVKDHDKRIGTWRGARLCGQGDLDWHTVLSALREAGYDGYLMIETPPPEKEGQMTRYPEDGLEAARIGIDWLKGQLVRSFMEPVH